jgi:hypothetical protein
VGRVNINMTYFGFLQRLVRAFFENHIMCNFIYFFPPQLTIDLDGVGELIPKL